MHAEREVSMYFFLLCLLTKSIVAEDTNAKSVSSTEKKLDDVTIVPIASFLGISADKSSIDNPNLLDLGEKTGRIVGNDDRFFIKRFSIDPSRECPCVLIH